MSVNVSCYLNVILFCFKTQIGFVLFPTNIEHAWDLNDPNNSMIFSTLFGAYYASIYVIIGVNYALVSW